MAQIIWAPDFPMSAKFLRSLPRQLGGFASSCARWLSGRLVVVFILWSLWLAFPFLGFGNFSYVRIHDNGDSNLPARLALAPAVSDGLMGFWNPQGVAGTDRMAAGIIPDLINPLFLIFPGWLAYGLLMWLQRFIAGYFTFRLLRDSLGLEAGPAIFAGLVYSLFAQEAINVQPGFTIYDALALPGLPFVLWALARLEEKTNLRAFLGACGLALVYSLTSHYAYTLFLVPVIYFWFLFVVPRLSLKFWALIFLFTAVWVIGEVPAVWASLTHAPLSHRADWEYLSSSSLLSWREAMLTRAFFITGIIADNALALGAALLGLIIACGRERSLLVVVFATSLCLLFIFGYVPFRWTASNLGFLSGFQFDRIYLFIPFLASVAGGIGLQAVSRDWRLLLTGHASPLFDLSLQRLLVVIAICLIVFQSCLLNKRMLGELLRGSSYATLYEQPDLRQLAANSRARPPFRVATVDNGATDDIGSYKQHPSYVWAYGLESVDGYVALYSQRYQDFWEQVVAPLFAAHQRRYNYFRNWGSRVYLFSPANGFPHQTEVRFGDYYNLNLLSLANARYIISPVALQDENLTLLPSGRRDAQLSWAAQPVHRKLMSLLRGEYPGVPLYIYENRQVLPRFFLAGQAQLFAGADELLLALRQAEMSALRTTVFVTRAEAGEVPFDTLVGQSGEVELRQYGADRITLDTNAAAASILVVTNNYSPHWRAWVDGTAAHIFPVNHTFQGIYLPGGKHEVVFEYAPPYAPSSN